MQTTIQNTKLKLLSIIPPFPHVHFSKDLSGPYIPDICDLYSKSEIVLAYKFDTCRYPDDICPVHFGV